MQKGKNILTFPLLPSQLGNTTLISSSFPLLKGTENSISSNRLSSFHPQRMPSEAQRGLEAEGNCEGIKKEMACK